MGYVQEIARSAAGVKVLSLFEMLDHWSIDGHQPETLRVRVSPSPAMCWSEVACSCGLADRASLGGETYVAAAIVAWRSGCGSRADAESGSR